MVDLLPASGPALGLPPSSLTFYEVYGLFRLAGIAQQIYYRYSAGQTTNKAYEIFGPAANHLEQRCNQIIADAG